jgi:hypothetical protein
MDLSIDKRNWIYHALEKIFCNLDNFMKSLAKFSLLAITSTFMHSEDESNLDWGFLSVFWKQFLDKFSEEFPEIVILNNHANENLSDLKIIFLLEEYINSRRLKTSSVTKAENGTARGRLNILPKAFLFGDTKKQIWVPETLVYGAWFDFI